MTVTSIEWTATVQPDGSVTPGSTWNPVRGCSRVSEGCRNCYAERIAGRFEDGAFKGFAEMRFSDATKGGDGRFHGHWTGKVALVSEKLDEPLRWRKPRRVFVNSMSDLFHEALPDEAIDEVFAVMALSPWNTYQVLTKRPARMLAWFRERWQPAAATTIRVPGRVIEVPAETHGEDRHDQILRAAEFILAGPLGEQDRFWTANEGHLSHAQPWPLPNVWLGVSVEDQATADERIPLLLQTPAAKRFVSYEPALGPVAFEKYLGGRTGAGSEPLSADGKQRSGNRRVGGEPARSPEPNAGPNSTIDAASAAQGRLDWIICGGESGPGARPFDVAWARSARDQCRRASCAFFMKQLGANVTWGCDVTAGNYERTRFPSTARDLTKRADGSYRVHLNSSKGGDPSEWPEDLRVREFPGDAR